MRIKSTLSPFMIGSLLGFSLSITTHIIATTIAIATPTPRVIINHEVQDIDGSSVKLSDYRGKALLIVNTASHCGFTAQYAELVKLQAEYEARGFTVLAFPCNDFGGQEPGSPSEIKRFCSSQFKINFPLFDKVKARGDKTPLYATLTSLPAPIGGEIRWNFTKFLVNPQGEVVARFEPGDSPTSDRVKRAVEAALPKSDH